jgi:PEP-CTERM motif
LFAAWFAAPNLAHADVIVGAPASTGSGDCIPFGCNFFDESNTDYQQVYGSTNFSGPITITALEFFHTIDFSGGGTEPQAGSYVISLSTTQAAVNGLDATDLSNNLGPDNTTVYSGDVPTLSGSVLKFILTTPFTYDPSKGNLLLDVQLEYGDTEGIIYFDSNGEAGLASRASSSNDGFADDAAVVTGFSTTGSVPEPSTWAMMLMGFAGLVYGSYSTTRRTAARVG